MAIGKKYSNNVNSFIMVILYHYFCFCTLCAHLNYVLTFSIYRVMRVTPPQFPPKIVDGKFPENDVKIELM